MSELVGKQPEVPVRDGAEATVSRVFVVNLSLFLIFGVYGCWWLIYFTDAFPQIGGLLALGGAFSWLAFASKIIADERRRELQTWADRIIWSNPWTRWVFVAMVSASLLLTSLFGSIQVESTHGVADRDLVIASLGSAPVEPVALPSAGKVRRPVWVSWSSSTWRVKISGYPDRTVTVGPFRRIDLALPRSFLRPVALLRPTIGLFDAVHNLPRNENLLVRIGTQQFRTSFDGRAIWVSDDDDLEVPSSLETAWHAELGAQNRPSILYYWLHPQKLPGLRVGPPPGTDVHVSVLDADNKPFVQASFTVRSVEGREDFVQEVKLDVPSN